MSSKSFVCLTRRRFMVLVAGGVASLAAACATTAPSLPSESPKSGASATQPTAGAPPVQQPTQAAPGGQQVERQLVFWHSYTQPERVESMQKIAASFEQQHAGVKVAIEVVPWPAFPQKWPAAHAANQLPDVTVLTPEHAVAMWEAGAIHPMDEVIELLGGEDAFKPGILEKTSKWQGNFVAVPHYAHSRLLLQRSDWLSELGYGPDFAEEPPTWDKALEAAKAMTKAPDRYGWILQLNKNDYGGVLTLQQLMRSNGAEFFDPDGNVTFDSPEARECVEFLVEVYKNAHPPGAVEYRVQDAFNLVNTGKSGFSLETAFVVSVAVRDAPDVADNLKGGYPPQKKNVGWVSEPITITTPKGKNPEDAKQFIKFLFDDANYIPFLHTVPAGMYPSLKKTAESQAFWDHPIVQKLKVEAERTLEGMEKGSQVGFDHGPNPYAAILKTGITEEMLQRIFLENVPVKQAVSETAEKMQEQAEDIKRKMQRS